MNLKRFYFFLFLQLLSVVAVAQCFIPNATIKYCQDELTIDLTSTEVQINGTYKYFFNGAKIFIPEFWTPIPFAILDGEFTEYGTGCVATFKLTVEGIVISEPDLETEYFLSCFQPHITLDPNVNSATILNYFWYLNGGVIANSEVIQVETGGVYTLVVEAFNSDCTVSAEVLVQNIPFENYTTDIIYNCDTTATFIIDFQNDNANITVEWDGIGIVDDADPYELTVDTIGNFTGVITNIETGCITPFQFEIDTLDCTISAFNTIAAPVDLTIFPNPFSKLLNVSTTKNIQSLLLLDQSGRIIMEKRIPSEELSSLDLSQLPAGIYFLGLQIEAQFSWHKVVKN